MSKSIKLSELGMVSGKAYFVKVAYKETPDGQWSDPSDLVKFATKPAFTPPSRSAITAPLGGTWLDSDTATLTVDYQSLDGLARQSTLYQVSTSSTFETILKEGEDTNNPIRITGLPGNRLLYFRVKSKDSAGGVSTEWSNPVTYYGEERIPKIGFVTINGKPASQIRAIRNSGRLSLTCDPFSSTDPTATLKYYQWAVSIRTPDSNSPEGFRDRANSGSISETPDISIDIDELVRRNKLQIGEYVRVRVSVTDNYDGRSWWKQPLDLLVSDGTMAQPTVTIQSKDTKPYVLEGSPYTYDISPLDYSEWVIKEVINLRTLETKKVKGSTRFESSVGIGQQLQAYVRYVAQDGTYSEHSETIDFTPGYAETKARPGPKWVYPTNNTTVREVYKRFLLDADGEDINQVELEYVEKDSSSSPSTINSNHRDIYNPTDVGLDFQYGLNSYLNEGHEYLIRARYKTTERDVWSNWSEQISIRINDVLAHAPPESETLSQPAILTTGLTIVPREITLSDYSSSSLSPWNSTELELSYDGGFSSVFYRKILTHQEGSNNPATLSNIEIPSDVNPEGPIYARARYSSQNESKGGVHYSSWGQVKKFYAKRAKANFIEFRGDVVGPALIEDSQSSGYIQLSTAPLKDGAILSWRVTAYNERSERLPRLGTFREEVVSGEGSKYTITLNRSPEVAYYEVNYTTDDRDAPDIHTLRIFLKYVSAFENLFVDYKGEAKLLKPDFVVKYPTINGEYVVTETSCELDLKPPAYIANTPGEYVSISPRTCHVKVAKVDDPTFASAKTYDYDQGEIGKIPNIFIFQGQEVDEVLVKCELETYENVSIESKTIRLKNGIHYLTAPKVAALSPVNPSLNNGVVTVQTEGQHKRIPGPVIARMEFKATSIKNGNEYFFEESSFPIFSSELAGRFNLKFTSDDLVEIKARVSYDENRRSDWGEGITVEITNSHPNASQARVAPTITAERTDEYLRTETITLNLSAPSDPSGIGLPAKSYWLIREEPYDRPGEEYVVAKTEDISQFEYRPRLDSCVTTIRAAYSVGQTEEKSQYSQPFEITVLPKEHRNFRISKPYYTLTSTTRSLGRSKWFNGEGVREIEAYPYKDVIEMQPSYSDALSGMVKLVYQTSFDPDFLRIHDEQVIYRPSEMQLNGFILNSSYYPLPYRRKTVKENLYVRFKVYGSVPTAWSEPMKFVYFDPTVLDPVLYAPEENVYVTALSDTETIGTRDGSVKFIPLSRYAGEISGRRIETGFHTLSNTFSSLDNPGENLTGSSEVMQLANLENSNEYALVYARIISGGASRGYRYFPVRLRQSRVKNGHPETPAILSPSANSEHKNYVRLFATPFKSERSGRTHQSTKWIISEPHRQHAIVKEITTTENLTSITLAGKNALPPGPTKVYSVRVEYTDNTGVKSIQSAPLWFKYSGDQ